MVDMFLSLQFVTDLYNFVANVSCVLLCQLGVLIDKSLSIIFDQMFVRFT